MLKRFLMMLLICGYLLYAPTARACEESPLPYWMDYQAFLSEYRSAIVEDRDTIGGWQLSAAAKVAGPEGTGYAFVWMDEDDVPELSSIVRVDHRRYGRTTQLSFFQKKSYVGEDSV